jgi:ABC-2 type transport system ATP-binding protein
MRTNDWAIVTRRLTKRYGHVTALDALDLQIARGGIYGLLGRNGAGKTTTLKTLMGMCRAQEGDGLVLGRPLGDVDVRRKVAHVGEDREAWPGMTPGQVLAISRPLFPGWRRDLEQKYLEAFEIPSRRVVAALSKGTRTAFALVLAIARGAELLLLDEPADGLDAVLSERVQQAFVALAADDAAMTIVLSSHRLEDVERIADRVGILERGRLVFDESLEEMRASYRRVVLAFDGEPPEPLQHADGVRQARVEGRMMSLVVTRNVDQVVSQARERQAREIEVLPLSLKEVFLDESAHRGRREVPNALV